MINKPRSDCNKHIIKREHYSKKEGEWKPKKKFNDEIDALNWITKYKMYKYTAYVCKVCGKWHIGIKNNENNNMKQLTNYINENINQYFSENEKGKIMKDMWDKNGLFYKFMKDKVDHLTNEEIGDYLYNQCMEDDRCLAEFASYISEIIGRDNFDMKQVKKFINTEDLKG